MQSLKNILENLIPWWDAVIMFCSLLGVYLVVKGLFTLGMDRLRHGQGLSLVNINKQIFIGSSLLVTIYVLNAITHTFFKLSSRNGLTYTANVSSGISEQGAFLLAVGFNIVALIGLVAYLGSMYVLAGDNIGNNRTANAKAMVGVVAGALAINLDRVLLVIAATVGGDFEQSIQTFLPNA